MKPCLIVEQKITLFVNQYRIYEATPEGKKGALKAFAQQKRLALKERIDFYVDESKKEICFSLKAEKVIDLASRYAVLGANGKEIGSFKKEFKKSLLNSTWTIYDGKQPVLSVAESSLWLALIRRFGGFIPIVGNFVDILVAFLRYHFIFRSANGNEVGKYRKTTLFRDHYLLSTTDEVATDWRVLAAMAVALDALQSR